MAPPASRRSTNVLWSSDWNAATKALIGVAPGYRDTLVNLLCRDINETARCLGEECNALIRSDVRYFSLSCTLSSLNVPVVANLDDKLKEALIKWLKSLH